MSTGIEQSIKPWQERMDEHDARYGRSTGITAITFAKEEIADLRAALALAKREASTESAEGPTMVVPRYATNAIAVAIEREIDSQLVASGMSPGEMQRQDGHDVWEAAIGAVERAGALTDEAKDAALVEAERAGWREGMADAQEQLAEEIQKAARYDYLVSQYPCNIADALDCGISEIDEEIDRCIEHDAAIAHTKAQEGA